MNVLILYMNPTVPSSSSSTRNDKLLSASTDSDGEVIARKTEKISNKKRVSSTNKQARILPESFQPSADSVVVGKTRISKEAEGNFRLKALASTFLDRYASANTKAEKSEIVTTIVNMIRSICPIGAFVKQSEKDGRWYECPNGVAREKVGYCFRDLLHDKYKSSSASKAAKRRLVKQKQLSRSDSSGDVDSESGEDNDDSNSERSQDYNRFFESQIKAGLKTTGESSNDESSKGNDMERENPASGANDVSEFSHLMDTDLEPLPLVQQKDELMMQIDNRGLALLHSQSPPEAKAAEEGDSTRQTGEPSMKWYDDMEALMRATDDEEEPLDIGNLLPDHHG